jgi:hypothetical protein
MSRLSAGPASGLLLGGCGGLRGVQSRWRRLELVFEVADLSFEFEQTLFQSPDESVSFGTAWTTSRLHDPKLGRVDLSWWSW